MTSHRYVASLNDDGSWSILDTVTGKTPEPEGVPLRHLSKDIAKELARLLNSTGVLDEASSLHEGDP
jgi:hypothetical protein